MIKYTLLKTFCLTIIVLMTSSREIVAQNNYEIFSNMISQEKRMEKHKYFQYLQSLKSDTLFSVARLASSKKINNEEILYNIGYEIIQRINKGNDRSLFLNQITNENQTSKYSVFLLTILRSTHDSFNTEEQITAMEYSKEHISDISGQSSETKLAAILTANKIIATLAGNKILTAAEIINYEVLLRSVVNDNNEESIIRSVAIMGLQYLDSKEVVSDLMNVITSGTVLNDQHLARSVCIALSHFEEISAVPYIGDILLSTDDEYIYASAAIALGELGGVQALKLLIDNEGRFEGGYSGVSSRLLSSLVWELLETEDSEMLPYAIRATKYFYEGNKFGEASQEKLFDVNSYKPLLISLLYKTSDPKITKLILERVMQIVTRAEAKEIIEIIQNNSEYLEEWKLFNTIANGNILASTASSERTDEFLPPLNLNDHYKLQEYGDPGYRANDAEVFGWGLSWLGHTGICAGIDAENNIRIIEMKIYPVSSDTLTCAHHEYWSSMQDHDDYWGARTLNQTPGYMTFSRRANVVSTACYFAGTCSDLNLLGYTVNTIEFVPLQGDIIDPQEVISLRCDGLVEYCYEYNGNMVWGANGENYNISDIGNVFSHKTLYCNICSPDVQLAPVVQCGLEGGSSTHMTLPAAIDLPAYNASYVQYGSTVYVTLTANDRSGIHYIKYKVGSNSEWICSDIQPQHPQSSDYTCDFSFNANAPDTIYYYAKDNGGNYPQFAARTIVSSQTYNIVAAVGSNGQLDWDGDGWYPEGSNVVFSAIPDSGYEVEYWRLDGNIDPTDGNIYTLWNIQTSHFVNVTFKPVEQNSQIWVTQPNGGEEWFSDGRVTITWDFESDIGEYVIIDLYNNGIFDSHIELETTNDRSYRWGIPDDQATSSNYKVRISSLDGSSIYGQSDGFFTISPAIEIEPVQITTAAELQNVSSGGKYPPDAHYLLMNDIYASEVGNFSPIGPTISDRFRGTFDGNGYTIRELELYHPGGEYIGLFARLEPEAVIKNLNIEIDNVEGAYRIGSLAGMNGGTIENCNIIINDLRGREGDSSIKGDIGGLTGRNYGVIRNCSVSSGAIDTDRTVEDVGGLAGFNSGTIEWCSTNNLDIYAYVDNVGALVGRNEGVVVECYTEGGQVQGDYYTGGIVGAQSGTIYDCYSSIDLIDASSCAGGIVGSYGGGDISRVYSNSPITVNSEGGALIGRNNATITHSFWNRDVTIIDQATGNGGGVVDSCYSKVSSEMMQQVTFTTLHSANWDFINVWAINEGVGFPVLRGIGPVIPIPNNLVASTDQHDGIHLSWPMVTYETEPSSGDTYGAFYQIYQSETPEFDATRIELTDWQLSNEFVDTTVMSGLPYYYSVRSAATNRGARASQLSSFAEGQRTYPPADTPTGVLASDSLTHFILIEWEGVNNANYYQVYRSVSVEGSKTPISIWQSGLSYTDTPPIPETEYYYWVRAAKNDAGGDVSEYAGPDSGYYFEPDESLPTISVSIEPEHPIETQSCVLHILAEDNDVLQTVLLYWIADGIQDSLAWNDIGEKTLDASHPIGAFSYSETVAYWARAWDASENKTESDYNATVVQPEFVTQPSRPDGPVYLKANQSGSYLTGGSETNLGSSVQYRFDWADGLSSWGDSIASRAWGTDGVFLVKSRARSLADTNRVSARSVGFIVSVDSRPPTVSIDTNNGDNVTTWTDSITISGESADSEPSSGVVSTTINTGSSNTGDTYIWSFHIVSLEEGINEIVVTSADNAGNSNSDTIGVTYDPNLPDPNKIPEAFALYQNVPNPFNPTTTIKFDLAQPGLVKLSIYNVKGELISTLVDCHMTEGSKEVTWNAKDEGGFTVSTGIYFYRLATAEFVETKKMVLLR